MKKIIILCMSCNDTFFMQEEQNIRETWGYSVLTNQYPNVSLYFYRASQDSKYHVDTQKHILYVPSSDSLTGTYEKTHKTFQLLKSLNIEYDYIFRTNCSTYVNVPILISFINSSIINPEFIYAGLLYSFNNGQNNHPEPFAISPVGNAMILSKEIISLLTPTNYTIMKESSLIKNPDNFSYAVDDNVIAGIFNTYHKNLGHDYLNYYKSLGLPNIYDSNLPLKAIAYKGRVYNNILRKEIEINNLKAFHKLYKNNLNDNLSYININIENDLVQFITREKGNYSDFINKYEIKKLQGIL